MMHLDNKRIQTFLDQHTGKNSSYKYILLVNNAPSRKKRGREHADCEVGGFKPVDIGKAPFKTDAHWSLLATIESDATKQVYLWTNPRKVPRPCSYYNAAAAAAHLGACGSRCGYVDGISERLRDVGFTKVCGVSVETSVVPCARACYLPTGHESACACAGHDLGLGIAEEPPVVPRRKREKVLVRAAEVTLAELEELAAAGEEQAQSAQAVLVEGEPEEDEGVMTDPESIRAWKLISRRFRVVVEAQYATLKAPLNFTDAHNWPSEVPAPPEVLFSRAQGLLEDYRDWCVTSEASVSAEIVKHLSDLRARLRQRMSSKPVGGAFKGW
jgi:hypothetical protein